MQSPLQRQQLGRRSLQLSRAHVWLSQCPEGLHPGVWDIVVMVAVAAMNRALHFMVVQHSFAQAPVPLGPELGRRGAERARVSFWELLHEFAASGCTPSGVTSGVPLDTAHPFLCSTSACAIRVQMPNTG